MLLILHYLSYVSILALFKLLSSLGFPGVVLTWRSVLVLLVHVLAFEQKKNSEYMFRP